MSRRIYSKLREDYQLPSVTTLARLISKVGNTDDLTFIKEVDSGVTERQRTVIILTDEVDVKSTLYYHGGKVFGRAHNNPNKLARTVLGIMIKCLFGGLEFLVKMIPVCDLNAEFQYEQVSTIMKRLTQSGANVVAIISDGNRVNKKFF